MFLNCVIYLFLFFLFHIEVLCAKMATNFQKEMKSIMFEISKSYIHLKF